MLIASGHGGEPQHPSTNPFEWPLPPGVHPEVPGAGAHEDSGHDSPVALTVFKADSGMSSGDEPSEDFSFDRLKSSDDSVPSSKSDHAAPASAPTPALEGRGRSSSSGGKAKKSAPGPSPKSPGASGPGTAGALDHGALPVMSVAAEFMQQLQALDGRHITGSALAGAPLPAGPTSTQSRLERLGHMPLAAQALGTDSAELRLGLMPLAAQPLGPDSAELEGRGEALDSAVARGQGAAPAAKPRGRAVRAQRNESSDSAHSASSAQSAHAKPAIRAVVGAGLRPSTAGQRGASQRPKTAQPTAAARTSQDSAKPMPPGSEAPKSPAPGTRAAASPGGVQGSGAQERQDGSFLALGTRSVSPAPEQTQKRAPRAARSAEGRNKEEIARALAAGTSPSRVGERSLVYSTQHYEEVRVDGVAGARQGQESQGAKAKAGKKAPSTADKNGSSSEGRDAVVEDAREEETAGMDALKEKKKERRQKAAARRKERLAQGISDFPIQPRISVSSTEATPAQPPIAATSAPVAPAPPPAPVPPAGPAAAATPLVEPSRTGPAAADQVIPPGGRTRALGRDQEDDVEVRPAVQDTVHEAPSTRPRTAGPSGRVQGIVLTPGLIVGGTTNTRTAPSEAAPEARSAKASAEKKGPPRQSKSTSGANAGKTVQGSNPSSAGEKKMSGSGSGEKAKKPKAKASSMNKTGSAQLSQIRTSAPRSSPMEDATPSPRPRTPTRAYIQSAAAAIGLASPRPSAQASPTDAEQAHFQRSASTPAPRAGKGKSKSKSRSQVQEAPASGPTTNASIDGTPGTPRTPRPQTGAGLDAGLLSPARSFTRSPFRVRPKSPLLEHEKSPRASTRPRSPFSLSMRAPLTPPPGRATGEEAGAAPRSPSPVPFIGFLKGLASPLASSGGSFREPSAIPDMALDAVTPRGGPGAADASSQEDPNQVRASPGPQHRNRKSLEEPRSPAPARATSMKHGSELAAAGPSAPSTPKSKRSQSQVPHERPATSPFRTRMRSTGASTELEPTSAPPRSGLRTPDRPRSPRAGRQQDASSTAAKAGGQSAGGIVESVGTRSESVRSPLRRAEGSGFRSPFRGSSNREKDGSTRTDAGSRSPMRFLSNQFEKLPKPMWSKDEGGMALVSGLASPVRSMSRPLSPSPSTKSMRKPAMAARVPAEGSDPNTGFLRRGLYNMSTYYDMGQKIGEGRTGVIVYACTDKVTGEQFACKSIAKTTLTDEKKIEALRREVQVMEMLKENPSVVTLREALEDERDVHLVMELCEGGDLLTFINTAPHISERQAATMCRTLAKAVKFCHDQGVVHRDLKPENILMTSKGSWWDLRLADFGICAFVKPGEKLKGYAGSAFYIAPEVLRGMYSQPVDVWSLGVILYVLLSQKLPFWSENDAGVYRQILKGEYDLATGPWASISAGAKSLVQRMLTLDSSARPSLEDVIDDPWIHATAAPEEAISMRLPSPDPSLRAARRRRTIARSSAYMIATFRLPFCLTPPIELTAASDAEQDLPSFRG